MEYYADFKIKYIPTSNFIAIFIHIYVHIIFASTCIFMYLHLYHYIYIYIVGKIILVKNVKYIGDYNINIIIKPLIR